MTLIMDWETVPLDELTSDIKETTDAGGLPLEQIEEVNRRLLSGEATEDQIPPDVLAIVKNPPPDPFADKDTV